MEFETNVVHITIYGAFSKIIGDVPWNSVVAVTSYTQEGAQFSKAYKRGLWNGRVNLLNKKTGSFPTGLLSLVKEVCAEEGKEVLVHDQRTDPGSMGIWSRGTLDLAKATMTGKYQYQMDSCKAAIEAKSGILKLCTGFGKTYLAAALISYYQLPTLIIVPSKELLYQTRNVLLEQIIGATEETIGVIGDNEWQVGSLATVAIIDTLASRFDTQECRTLLDNTDLLIGDEVHYSGSDSFYDILNSCNAYHRFGLSGTPLDRSDGANLKVIALFGDIITEVRTKQLVESGVLPNAKIIFDKISKPAITGKIAYSTAYKLGVVENEYLNKRIVEWTKACVDNGLSVLILVDMIAHGRTLDEMLWQVEDGFIPHTFINGQSGEKSNRKDGFEAFDKREIPVLISSDILSTGISSKAIDVLILAGAKKSKIKTIQRLGRTLRGEKAIVIEFSNYCNKYLLEHSLIRLRDYKAENCFEIISSGPDKELIKKLWNET
jgi:superfamily II DNA or RNA helicase